MRRKYDWARIDPLVIAAYEARATQAGAPITALAAAVGVPRPVLSKRASLLHRAGRLRGRYRRHWAPGEDAVLERWYGKARAPATAPPGRAEQARGRRANLLGLRITGDGYNAAMVAEAIGCSQGAVCHWIRRGYLRATKVAGRPRPGRAWCISERALAAFFRAYPHLWSRHACPGRAWIEALITAPDLRRAAAGKETP